MDPNNDAAGATATDSATAGGEATPSMEDTARDTYRELMSEGPDDTGAEQAAAGSAETQAAAGLVRGPDGKFVKGTVQASQDAVSAAQTVTDPAAASSVDPGQQAVQTAPHDAFPNTWRRELADTWKTLPPTVREEIHRRESDFHNGIRQYRDAAQFGQGIAQEMLPYQQTMQQRGVQPRELVRDIMGALNTMATGTDEQKASTFLQLASNYGINLEAVQSLRQRAPGGVAPELAPVLQRIRQVESTLETQAQDRERIQSEEDLATVQRFINDPKNELAKQVQAEMASLLRSGEARDLQEAYDKAIWLNPQTRAALLSKQEQERKTRDAAEAAAARKAAGANVARRGTAPRAATQPGTMEDTARSVYRDLVSSG